MKKGGEEGEKPREICITRKIDWASHIKDWGDRLSASAVGWSKHRREAFATTMLHTQLFLVGPTSQSKMACYIGAKDRQTWLCSWLSKRSQKWVTIHRDVGKMPFFPLGLPPSSCEPHGDPAPFSCSNLPAFVVQDHKTSL